MHWRVGNQPGPDSAFAVSPSCPWILYQNWRAPEHVSLCSSMPTGSVLTGQVLCGFMSIAVRPCPEDVVHASLGWELEGFPGKQRGEGSGNARKWLWETVIFLIPWETERKETGGENQGLSGLTPKSSVFPGSPKELAWWVMESEVCCTLYMWKGVRGWKLIRIFSL